MKEVSVPEICEVTAFYDYLSIYLYYYLHSNLASQGLTPTVPVYLTRLVDT